MTTPTPGIRIRAEHLRDLLTAGLSCTSTDPDDDNPYFTNLNLTAGNGRLTVLATDRFGLAHATRPAEGELEQAILPAAGARRMLTDLQPLRRDEVVTLTVSQNLISLITSAGAIAAVAGKDTAALPSAAADLLSTDGYDQVGLTGPIGFTGPMLARLADATAHHGPVPALLFFRSPTLPLRIEVEDWLVLLFMPVLLPPTVDRPAIPAGLPGEPLRVDLVDVDHGDTDWPTDVEQATALRLARHYAASMLNTQHRVFEQPWPAVPDNAEPTTEQKLLAAGRMDLHMHLADSYALAKLLRAFHAVAPAAANEVARDLWEDIQYADDNLGSNSWEWLQQDGCDPESLDHDAILDGHEQRAERIHNEVVAAGRPASAAG
jgi:hypothetical protein